jgi:lauroyl/myristoyl acyltransferase
MPSNPSSSTASEAGAPPESKPKGRWTKPFEWWATRQTLRGLRGFGRVIPRATLAPMGRSLGALAYRTMPRYRKVALSNLHRAFGDTWDDARIEHVARESFAHLGITLVEFFLLQPSMTLEMAAREIGFEGQEHYEEAFARGKGVLLITAHYGNWEMMGPRSRCNQRT